MYYETSIGKLSKVQLNNLLKGKRVRVKRGTAHKVNLTQEQLYKFNHNTSKGKALTIKLNQDQIAKQGSGIIGHLVGKIHPGVGKLANMVGLGMRMRSPSAKQKKGRGLAADLIGLVHPTAGKLASMVGLGMRMRSPSAKQKKGRGLAADLIGLVHPTAGKLASIVGLGAQKKTYRPKTLGAGFIEDLAKQAAVNLAKTAGKFAVDKSLELGGNYVKGKIEGLGLKGVPATEKQRQALAFGRTIRAANILASGKKPRRKTGRKATPAQLAALARGRATRDANRLAKMGGALYVA
jgi:hypothetical protein